MRQGLIESLLNGILLLLSVLIMISSIIYITYAWAIPLAQGIDPGHSALKQRDYDEVIRICERRLVLQPDDVEAHELLSVAYAATGQTEKALNSLYIVKKSKPDSLFVHLCQCVINQNQGEFNKSIPECKRAIDFDKENLLAHHTLGRAYLANRDFTDAEKTFRKSIEIDPNFSQGYIGLGATYLLQDKMQEAWQHYKKAVEIDPDDYGAHVGLATLYKKMEMYNAAIAEYRTVLQMKPDLTEAQYNLASLYFQLDRYGDSISQSRGILNADPNNHQARLLLARSFATMEQFDEAIKNIKELLARQDDSAEGRYLLGLFLMTRGDLQAAKVELEKVERIYEDQADTFIATGIIQHIENNVKDAVRNFEKAILKGSNETDAIVHFMLANIYLSQGNPTEAERHLKEAKGFVPGFRLDGLNPAVLSTQPRPSWSKTNLATLYYFKDWHNKAIEVCDKALNEADDNPIPIYLKAKALMERKEFEKAILLFERVCTLQPPFISPHYDLAALYLTLNDFDRAVDQYKRIITMDPADVSAYIGLGGVFGSYKKNREAIDVFNKVIELIPNSPVGYNEVAYFYAEEGKNLDEALAKALKAEELSPENGGVLDTLGWVYFKKGDYERAKEKLEKAAQLVPNSPTIRYHLGMTLFERREFQNAKAEFSKALNISTTFEEAEKTKAMLREIEKQLDKNRE